MVPEIRKALAPHASKFIETPGLSHQATSPPASDEGGGASWDVLCAGAPGLAFDNVRAHVMVC